MQIVTFPPSLIDSYLEDLRLIMQSGRVAEDHYVRQSYRSYVPGKWSLPVCSGGAALFTLLAYYKNVHAKRIAIIQSNTMRALYTVPTLLDLKTMVVDSSYADFLAMSGDSLERALRDDSTRKAAVVLYSVIGGYLAPSFDRIAELCRKTQVPLIVDAAHGHYLTHLTDLPDVDVAYSFYATKVLPAGEGGLVVTHNELAHDWLRRFVMYDRFDNELPVGLNLRASELAALLIHKLMTDTTLIDHYSTPRVEIADAYAAICERQGIRYIDHKRAAAYNGYKFVILDPVERVKQLGTLLTAHPPTSGVFDTDVLGRPTALHHWCPPTYTSLRPGVHS